jgi:hypothetical protein
MAEHVTENLMPKQCKMTKPEQGNNKNVKKRYNKNKKITSHSSKYVPGWARIFSPKSFIL